MDLEEDIILAGERLEWLYDQIDDLFIPKNLTVPCSLLYISMQLSDGSLILLQNKREAPAFALVRSTYETFLRAMWFVHKATEAEKTNALNDRFPKLSVIVDSFRNDENGNAWVRIYSDINTMNSFTHGGMAQILSHWNGETLQPNFDARDINVLIDTSIRLAIISSCTLANLAGRKDINDAILDKLYDIYSGEIQ